MSRASVPDTFRAALRALDRAVRHGEDPTAALAALDTLLAGPPPSAAVLRELLDAAAALAASWVQASAPLLDRAREATSEPDFSPRTDLVDRLVAGTSDRIADAVAHDDLQGAVDALFLGGALLRRLGADDAPMLVLLARLEHVYGEAAVDAAMDGAWGGALAS